MAAKGASGEGDGYDHSTHVKMDGEIFALRERSKKSPVRVRFRNELLGDTWIFYVLRVIRLIIIIIFFLNLQGRKKRKFYLNKNNKPMKIQTVSIRLVKFSICSNKIS